MANFNKVIVAGNLVADPELRYTPKGTAIAHIRLAVNRVYTTEAGEKKEEVTYGSWLRVVSSTTPGKTNRPARNGAN